MGGQPWVSGSLTSVILAQQILAYHVQTPWHALPLPTSKNPVPGSCSFFYTALFSTHREGVVFSALPVCQIIVLSPANISLVSLLLPSGEGWQP